ncbi:MAG: TolC family protein [Flavobacteriales bacterium]|nr:TolC family protein [Flavobacteriales bacterium]
MNKIYNKIALTALVICGVWSGVMSQSLEKTKMTLADAITIATDSSLAAFSARNTYLASYWEYRTYKAQDLPQLNLSSTPVSYNQNFVSRYISETNTEEYRAQQTLNSSIGLTVKQQIRPLGGSVYISTDLAYYKNFSLSENEQQFSSTPVKIGYTQPLFGYNEFRWDKKIQPLKYEVAKKNLLYSVETISEKVTDLFFALISAQTSYQMALTDMKNADSLCVMGRQRYDIASISKADMLTLELDVLNAGNTLENSRLSLKRAKFNYLSYLNLPESTDVELILPDIPTNDKIDPQQALEYTMTNNPKVQEFKQKELQAKANVQRAKIESRFSANLNASVGFNQVAYDFTGAYRDLRRQDMIYLTLSIPILDWGIARGKYNTALSNYQVIKVSNQQDKISLEQEVIMTVSEFNIQQSLINTASRALVLAREAYQNTVQRFKIGEADVNAISLALQRQNTAQTSYVTALKNYWESYAKIRRLTLYDYAKGRSIADDFDKVYSISKR